MRKLVVLFSLFICSIMVLDANNSSNASESSYLVGNEIIFYTDDCAIKVSPLQFSGEFYIEIMPYSGYYSWLAGNNDVYSYSSLVYNEPNGPWSPAFSGIIDKSQPVTTVGNITAGYRFELYITKNGSVVGRVIIESI